MAAASPSLPTFTQLSDRDYEQNYYENMLNIKALLYLLPGEQRKRIIKWVAILEGLTSQPASLKKRNLFTWYLLEQLKADKIGSPFTRDPVAGQLPDEHMLPQSVWFDFHEVVSTMKAEAEEMRKKDFHTSVKQIIPEVRPINFIYRQPCPKSGFTAFGACFSNQYK